jgi:hypothetical protein
MNEPMKLCRRLLVHVRFVVYETSLG